MSGVNGELINVNCAMCRSTDVLFRWSFCSNLSISGHIIIMFCYFVLVNKDVHINFQWCIFVEKSFS